MRVFVSLLLVAGLSVSAGEFVDKAVGLKMNVPDGWERDEAREKGSVKFAASLRVDRDKYVTLTVEAVPADGFSAVDWLSNEKKFKASHYIAEVATNFTSDQDTRVGGLDAVGYVFGGKAKDRDGTVHFKVYGIVHGEIFFQITESSFNGAHNKVSDQLKEIWDGIMFQEGDDDDEGIDIGFGCGGEPVEDLDEIRKKNVGLAGGGKGGKGDASMKAIPPPLVVMGRKVGNTVADPAFAKVRKDTVALEAEAYKRYLIEYEVTLPKGFVLIKEGFGKPTNHAMIVYAQDGANNWVQIIITNSNAKVANEEGKRLPFPKEEAETWRSNWSAKARGTKVPTKVQRFSLGKIRGRGFREMVGKVDGFPGTFTGIMSDKFPGKSWRTRVSVETRGDATVWTEALKVFFRKIKAEDIKVKR